ncbi:MAG: flagellar biosynthetic protein FliO [Acidobacteriota bacterium]|nr:flagellar biosynthetic protein FliO [Acidobacteriota bacterium]
MADSAGPGLIDILRVAGALLIVAALAAALGLLARRGVRSPSTRRLQVCERLVLSRGVQLVVVADGERRLLVGVSDKGVNLVSELTAEGDVVEAELDTDEPTPPRLRQVCGGFAERLAEQLRSRVAARGGRA